MQIYEKSNDVVKELLISFLKNLQVKVKNDNLTADEFESLFRSLLKESKVYATAEELSDIYHQPIQNVRNIISRKVVTKPLRKVYYPLHEFDSVVPDSWRKKQREDID